MRTSRAGFGVCIRQRHAQVFRKATLRSTLITLQVQGDYVDDITLQVQGDTAQGCAAQTHKQLQKLKGALRRDNMALNDSKQ